MSFSRIAGDTFNDADALKARDAVNAAIGAVAAEEASIEADGAALVTRALNADPEDAGKLAKAVEALRLRKLRNLLAEMQIPKLKTVAEAALRQAAAREGGRQENNLQTHEGDMRKSAGALGYAEGSREYHQLFVTDPTRRAILTARNAAQFAMGNLHVVTPDDRMREAELRGEIAAALK